MSLNKFKAAAAVLLVVGALGTLGAALQPLQARVEPPPPDGTRVEPPQDAKPTPAPDGKPKTDTEKLQGTWKVIETRVDGETYPTDEKTDHRLVIEGDKFRLTSMPKEPPKLGLYGGMTFIATFKLNTKTSPRNIDLEMSKDPEAHEVCLGIYKLDGDDLMICLPYLKPCERRPTEFKAEKGPDQQLYKLRRAKPAKK